MTLPVEWQSAARHDLAEIIAFIASNNPYAARALKDQVEAAPLPLSDHPYLGRAGRVAGTRELLAHPNYWLVYRVGSISVEILAVLHARQQYP
ncbi:type II toxin-antitoxin system RelE/ParE family toxin [Luteimonas sp. A277]